MSQWVSSHHNNADEYVGSALPFATGSVRVHTTPMVVRFPYVTRWVRVTNTGTTTALRVGFTENGVNAARVDGEESCYFKLSALTGSTSSGRLELKTAELWLRADAGTHTQFDIVAGYTNIPKNRFVNLTGSEGFSGVG